MEFLRKLAERQAGQAQANPPDQRTPLRQPLLWELLTTTEYSDGSKRIPSTVKVTKGSGVWSVTLQDDELRIQLRVEVNDLESVWATLEKVLADPEAKWVPFKSYKNPERQKKKGEKKA